MTPQTRGAFANMGLSHDVVASLSQIELLAMDVDGVLTDGSIHYDDAGRETKRFHVADGLGLVLLRQIDIKVGWISGRSHVGVERRARELGVAHLLQGIRDKRVALKRMCREAGISLEKVAYIGDDWNDLPVFDLVGLRIAVCNAEAEVKEAADLITQRSGGGGAVRDVCMLLLDARQPRDRTLALYSAALETATPEGSGQ